MPWYREVEERLVKRDEKLNAAEQRLVAIHTDLQALELREELWQEARHVRKLAYGALIVGLVAFLAAAIT